MAVNSKCNIWKVINWWCYTLFITSLGIFFMWSLYVLNPVLVYNISLNVQYTFKISKDDHKTIPNMLWIMKNRFTRNVGDGRQYLRLRLTQSCKISTEEEEEEEGTPSLSSRWPNIDMDMFCLDFLVVFQFRYITGPGIVKNEYGESKDQTEALWQVSPFL